MGMSPQTVHEWNGEDLVPRDVVVPEEALAQIYVNGKPVVQVACSPRQMEALGVGFLFTSGLIDTAGSVTGVHANDQHCIDIWTSHEITVDPGQAVLTSGCGRAVAFHVNGKSLSPLHPPAPVDYAEVTRRMNLLLAEAKTYHETRGLHASALFSPQGDLLFIAEDIGRHNTIDKLAGACLLGGVPTEGLGLFTTGRVSGEMVWKAARMRIALIASLTAFTSLAAGHASELGMTAIGYVRGKSMRIYSPIPA